MAVSRRTRPPRQFLAQASRLPKAFIDFGHVTNMLPAFQMFNKKIEPKTVAVRTLPFLECRSKSQAPVFLPLPACSDVPPSPRFNPVAVD
jgi:hypothetical protein